MADVRLRVPAASVAPVTLDLASLASIRKAAATILAVSEAIDLLVDNAGVMAIKRSETEDGFERQFGTNHLGHFAFTGLLLPALSVRSGSRVVTISSMAALIGLINFDDLQTTKRYSS